ncbi:hypothetical protein B0A52_00315 [Exophiala mesophila]|uniref:Protein BIG1 n=1 Tax=Exophiala mesophila TaxID=212818 RepID=A0A438NJQ5_EXOME|nr:hypothetical protein B0A52_00315 [Exophiala mesophila]
MHLTGLVASALLLLVEADTILAKAVIHLSDFHTRRDLEQDMKRGASSMLRRAPQEQDQSDNSLLGVTSSPSELNETIAKACIDALEPLTGVENDGGLTSCFNILQFDEDAHTFEADLRLYQTFEPRGSFANISVNDIMISLQFPSKTMFQSLTKKKRDLESRQSNVDMLEIQQYTLFGFLAKELDLKKLNDTQIMSLMLPDIKLNTAESQRAVSANITAGDGAWFVIGEFSRDFDASLVTAAAAADAISIAVPYKLPGVTLGIFPTGLIITGAWTLIFFLAYGFGTLGRIKYRDAYRKRMAASMGRTGAKI